MDDQFKRIWCPRCGKIYGSCPHYIVLNRGDYEVTDDEAARIRARYAIGRAHNPEHDTASYRDPKNPGENLTAR